MKGTVAHQFNHLAQLLAIKLNLPCAFHQSARELFDGGRIRLAVLGGCDGERAERVREVYAEAECRREEMWLGSFFPGRAVRALECKLRARGWGAGKTHERLCWKLSMPRQI